VSYSHDSPAHRERVLGLVNRLRADGVDCEIDQYEVSPPEGWPAWMHRQITTAKYVLVICTKTYRRRLMGDEVPGKGLGVRWEGEIITQELYRAAGRNERFIPVVFDDSDLPSIPVFLRPSTAYVLGEDGGYVALYRHLTNQPAVVRPPLGSRLTLPPVDDDAPADRGARVAFQYQGGWRRRPPPSDDVLRAALCKARERKTLRSLAAELGLSKTAVHSFSAGGTLQELTRRKLIIWYHQREAAASVANDVYRSLYPD
jgi:hypothetical protein